MSDAVNKPNHYMLFADGTEAIDVIRATLTPEEFRGYCKGNVLKYRLRAGKKDKLEQDIAKAETYAKMLGAAIAPVDSAPGAFYVVPKGYYKKPESFGFLISKPEHAFPPATRDECGPLMDCAKCKNPC